jgi:transcriptional regulator with XRE-family HTH domain
MDKIKYICNYLQYIFKMEAKIYKGYGARLEELRLYLGISKSKLAEYAGVTSQSMSFILDETTKNPGIDVFVNISEKTKANLLWLATGKGAMLTDRPVSTLNEKEDFGGFALEQLQSRITELKDMLETQRYTIQLQRSMLEGRPVMQGKSKGAILWPLSTKKTTLLATEKLIQLIG